jgi:uncharacterized protein
VSSFCRPFTALEIVQHRSSKETEPVTTTVDHADIRGTMGIVDGRSKPGDYVDLRAESRVLAVVSNCPQTRNPCNGFNPTPIRVVVSEQVIE